MTPLLLSPPEIPVPWHDELGELQDVLACPACRNPTQSPCPHLRTFFESRNGILYPTDQETTAVESEQQRFWESLEKVRGTYDLPAEQILQMPADPDTRALLEWLRRLLRERGSLRILQLNARRGWAARALAEDGHQVVATDLLDDAHIGLGCAVRLREQTGHRFACVRTGPTRLPFRAEAFDCVVGFDTLGQVPDLECVLQEVSRVLRPGGLFLALQEPFRGALTTQTEGLLDTTFYRLARWWLPGTLPGNANPELVYLRSRFGASLHQARRRVPFCRARAADTGLQTTILPTAVALSLSPTLQPLVVPDGKPPVWLNSLARAYALDMDRLNAVIDEASRAFSCDLIPELLLHWMLVGNMDGVLLARKGDCQPLPFQDLPSGDAERCRHLDPLLLACASDGFVPIYGVYPVQAEGSERSCWIQPRAGLIVPATDALELTLFCPPKPFTIGPVRLDIRLETERLPLAVVVLVPGERVTQRLPIPASAAVRHASLFVSFTANWGFLPSDLSPGPGADTRLLAIQLQGIRTGQGPAPDPATVLRQIPFLRAT